MNDEKLQSDPQGEPDRFCFVKAGFSLSAFIDHELLALADPILSDRKIAAMATETVIDLITCEALEIFAERDCYDLSIRKGKSVFFFEREEDRDYCQKILSAFMEENSLALCLAFANRFGKLKNDPNPFGNPPPPTDFKIEFSPFAAAGLRKCELEIKLSETNAASDRSKPKV